MSGVSENKRMRNRIVRVLKPLHACAVENSCCPGYPDVEFVGGTLELKEIPAWPKDPKSIVKVPHFTPQQRLWLRQRNKAGGYADVLLKVKNAWLLLNGLEAANHLGKNWRGNDIMEKSIASWYRLDNEDFLFVIRCCIKNETPTLIP